MKIPSGKFVLRLTPQQHLVLRKAAAAHAISLNEWILQSLFSTETPSQIVSLILATYKADVKSIILFGSVARADNTKASDIDLLIVLASSCPIDRNLYRKWDQEVLPLLGSQYSPQFSHSPDIQSASSLWLEVALDGKVLYDNGGGEKILQALRHQIASGHYQRKMSHGHAYWIHRRNDEE